MTLPEQIESLSGEGSTPAEVMKQLDLSQEQFDDLQPHYAAGHAVYRGAVFQRLQAGECVPVAQILRLQIPSDVAKARHLRGQNKQRRADEAEARKATREDGRGGGPERLHTGPQSRRGGRPSMTSLAEISNVLDNVGRDLAYIKTMLSEPAMQQHIQDLIADRAWGMWAGCWDCVGSVERGFGIA